MSHKATFFGGSECAGDLSKLRADQSCVESKVPLVIEAMQGECFEEFGSSRFTSHWLYEEREYVFAFEHVYKLLIS